MQLAPPEYVIARKLQVYREGHAEKDLHDIRSMLRISNALIDRNDLDRWTASAASRMSGERSGFATYRTSRRLPDTPRTRSKCLCSVREFGSPWLFLHRLSESAGAPIRSQQYIRAHLEARSGHYTVDHPGFSPEGYECINKGVQRIYEKVLRPDTEIDACFVPRSTFYTSHSYLETLNNAEIVRGIIAGEQQGYDVAFVRCGNDPAIREARESVKIPVVAMTESAMHLACQLGARFALIGVDDKSIPLVERNLRLYGLEGQAIARRPMRVPGRKVGANTWRTALRGSSRRTTCGST